MGISTITFNHYSWDTIRIAGNLGADGNGRRKHGHFKYKGWTAFWTQTHSAGDPSVTHVFITDAEKAQHDPSSDTDSDDDSVSGLKGANLAYLHWGVDRGAETAESVFQDVARAAVD